MKTSYFAKSANDPNAISIAMRAPEWFKGKEYKKLAPKWWILSSYWENGDEELYTERYYENILGNLNPKEVFDELGKDAILLCWEKSGRFCHRHLVSQWLKDKLDIEIEEVE